jgi:hypothetical protein
MARRGKDSMIIRKLVVSATAVAVVAGGGSAAMAAKKPPKTATIKAVEVDSFKINRYLQLGIRWKRDVYTVRSGGTLRLVNLAPGAGPHTFSVVKRKDLPRTKKQMNNCKVCNKLGKAHGADPNSQGPPKFIFLENGKGSNKPPKVNKAGDSALLGPKRGSALKLKVTAKKGKTLNFICIIHPWMQAKVRVR